jgi:hypothetical protein
MAVVADTSILTGNSKLSTLKDGRIDISGKYTENYRLHIRFDFDEERYILTFTHFNKLTS